MKPYWNPLLSLVGEMTGLEGAVDVEADTEGVSNVEDSVVGDGGVGERD